MVGHGGPWERRLAPTFRAFVEGLRPVESLPGAVPTPEELEAVTPRPWPARMLRRLRGR